MKGIYIVYDQVLAEGDTGINRKIKSQIETFNKNELNCEMKLIYINDKIKGISLWYRLPFFNLIPSWKNYEDFCDADYIYLRRPECMNGYMKKFFKNIKKKNPQIKILIEIPTYPYDQEILNNEGKISINYPIYWKDSFWRKRLKGVVDRFVVLNDNLPMLWDIPTIKINNGLLLENYSTRKPQKKDSIDLLAVAMFMSWHGYERIIEGLHTYYKQENNQKVYLHMVGTGEELKHYKKLVEEYHLEEYVVFHGKKTQEELDEFYNICDIGLGSFGTYKIGIELLKNLKSREYMAKGLPIVTGCKMDVGEKLEPYYLEFQNNESIVDINKIVDFYNNIYSNEKTEDVIKNIRMIAEKTISMNACMLQVINYIKGTES